MVTRPVELGAVCLPNISTAERRKRLVSGGVSLAITLVVLAVMLYFRISPWWRLFLFPLFGAAASGFFQWRDKTWVGLSARGSRKLGDVEEKIEDPVELAWVRDQARKVNQKSLVTAIILTLLTLLIPIIPFM